MNAMDKVLLILSVQSFARAMPVATFPKSTMQTYITAVANPAKIRMSMSDTNSILVPKLKHTNNYILYNRKCMHNGDPVSSTTINLI